MYNEILHCLFDQFEKLIDTNDKSETQVRLHRDAAMSLVDAYTDVMMSIPHVPEDVILDEYHIMYDWVSKIDK